MDVAIETMYQTKVAGDGCQTFHGIIRITHNTATEKQAFDIVTAVKLHRDLFEFANRKRGTLDIVGTTVDAVGTIIHTIIGQHDLQQ